MRVGPVMRMFKVAAVSYLLYAGLMFLLQRTMLFPGTRRAAAETASPARQGGQSLWLQGDFGRVEAWFLPARGIEGPAPALLFAHGNYELIDDWPGVFAPLRASGIALMLVEFPGYGRSTGSPTENSLKAAMAAAYDLLAARDDVDASRIVAYGRSLGGGAVCSLLPERRPAALILQSTFSSLAPFAHGLGLPAWLLRDRFDNAAALRSYSGPLLSVHGTRDDIIPHGHALRLRAVAATVQPIDYACAHNDCPPDFAAFFGQLQGFLEQHGILIREL